MQKDINSNSADNIRSESSAHAPSIDVTSLLAGYKQLSQAEPHPGNATDADGQLVFNADELYVNKTQEKTISNFNNSIKKELRDHPKEEARELKAAKALEQTIDQFAAASGEKNLSSQYLRSDEELLKKADEAGGKSEKRDEIKMLPAAETKDLNKLAEQMREQRQNLHKKYEHEPKPTPKPKPTPTPTPPPPPPPPLPTPGPLPSQNLNQAEQTATAYIDRNYTGSSQTQMLANLSSFEARCGDQGQSGATYADNLNGTVPDAGESPISQTQEIQSLDNVSQLLASQSSAAVGATDAQDVAYQEMALLANPACTDQGDHETCNVTTSEKTVFFDNPEEATSIITSQALTGTSTIDGNTVTVPTVDLTPDQEAGNDFTLPGGGASDGARGFASQLFQDAVLTDVGENENGDGALTQNFGNTDATWSNGQPFQGLYGSDIQWLDKQLNAGTNGGATVLEDTQDGNPPTTAVTDFSSESALLTQLQNLQTSNNLPATIIVGGDYLEGSPYNGPDHVVNIDGLQQDPSGNWQVYLNNQWGSSYNGWVSLDYLYNATVSPQSVGTTSSGKQTLVD